MICDIKSLSMDVEKNENNFEGNDTQDQQIPEIELKISLPTARMLVTSGF
eukprot:TRINITY_DN5_c0_g1_i1.p2 TRINITY_DN5_c0_g1~~TRINITY_DN5_c0_g1_i1.p2  ORF type:complete len:50 (-),score=20.60 TRINITY_DN5_c0_g1_i1:128-277(-)